MEHSNRSTRHHIPNPRHLGLKGEKEQSTLVNIQVPLQRSYDGSFCIERAWADEMCASLGFDRLVDRMHSIMGTKQNVYGGYKHLMECVRSYAQSGADFGQAYAYLRTRWQEDFDDIERVQATSSEFFRSRDVVEDGYIKSLKIPPRRVWDLYSNRVIPTWWMPKEKKITPISHAWVESADRAIQYLSINRRQWGVPLPAGVDINLIRIELLNLGFEYVWLDVLCLRQDDEEDAPPRKETEHAIDVPTIGHIYRRRYLGENEVVVYFGGLGRPFETIDLHDTRNWLNRAWTLQEVGEQIVIAGTTSHSPSIPTDNAIHKEFFERFAAAKELVGSNFPTISHSVAIIRNRSASNEIDKIYGLASILDCRELPVYSVKEHPENAWRNIIAVTSPATRAHLLFWYPKTGSTLYKWAPSWDQIMTGNVTPLNDGPHPFGHLSWSAKVGCFEGHFVVFGEAMIYDSPTGEFTAVKSSEGWTGTIKVRARKPNSEHEFRAVSESFPGAREAGSCTLIMAQCYGRFVVGREEKDGHFLKKWTLRVPDPKDYLMMEKLGERRDIRFR